MRRVLCRLGAHSWRIDRHADDLSGWIFRCECGAERVGE